jgi:hypothetical protein
LLSDHRVVGFRVRLLETAGRKASTRVRSFQPVASALAVDFRGEQLRALHVEDDAVQADLGPFEWLEIEAKW